MKTPSTAILLGVLILSGCSMAPSLTLKDIQPTRVFHLTRAEAFDAVRFFGIKESFRVDRVDEENGQILGHSVYQARPTSEANKLIVMNVRISAVDAEQSQVNASFGFSSVGDALTREEESILVSHYQNLFDLLESRSR